MRIFIAINDLYKKYKNVCQRKNQVAYNRILTLIQQNKMIKEEIELIKEKLNKNI